jgi:hypothetical protein
MPRLSQSDSAFADDAEGEPEHQEHDSQKNGYGRVFVCQHPVDLHAAAVLPALVAFTTDSAHTPSMKA